MPETKGGWFQRIEKMHPYQTLMYLGMFGSGLIFLFMTTAFLASDTSMVEATKFKMPKSFILSTFILLISGYTVSKLLLHYKEDSVQKLKNSLLITFFLGLIFTALQFIGWKELTLSGVDFRGLPTGSFLYVLTGIHIFHLIGAMTFALIMVYQYSRVEKDEVKNLVLLTNPYERMRIELFTTYWHFMDFIWLTLLMIFVFVF